MNELEKALQTLAANADFLEALDDHFGRSGLVTEIITDALELSRAWDPDAGELEDPE